MTSLHGVAAVFLVAVMAAVVVKTGARPQVLVVPCSKQALFCSVQREEACCCGSLSA